MTGMTMLRRGGPAVKTVTFAIVHFTVAFSIAYLFTGSASIAGALALVEPLANTAAYYLHERVWQAWTTRARTGAGQAA